MLALAAVALGLGAALAFCTYVALRSDVGAHRVALVALAVAVAGGGIAAQVAPTAGGASLAPEHVADGVPAADAASARPVGERPAAAAPAVAVDTAPPLPQRTASSPTAGASATRNATVVDVLGGDRVVYRTAAGDLRAVRLAGIDAPGIEGADPRRFDGVLTGSRGRACLAAQGRRTVRFLRAQLENESVTVRRTADGPGLPRVVLSVVGASTSMNRRLVARGRARAVDGRYADAQRSARTERAGVWACGVVEVTPPLRETDRPELRIVAVRPNPPGPDGDALDEEYLVVENVGRTTVDTGGWYVQSGDDVHFFESRELEPGSKLVVHVGSGRSTATDVYWGSTVPILDNDHDSLRLVDGGANRTARFSY